MPNIQNIEKHKWKKGQSGNPAGRPKGFPNLRMELETIIYSGDTNAIHDIAKALFDKAKTGDIRAIEFIMKLLYPDGIHKYEKEKEIDAIWGGGLPSFRNASDEINYYQSLDKEQ